ncbi:MAG: acyl-CoA dehydrogenase [Alcaligenaceae bacterium]
MTATATARDSDIFRDSARDFLRRHDFIARTRALRDKKPGFDRDVWLEMAQAGWFSVLIAEADGGLGLGLREMASIAQEVGEHLAPQPYIASAVQVAVALSHTPDSALRRELIDRLVVGKLIAGLAWQEQLGQLQIEAISEMQTTASLEGDSVILTGVKHFVTPTDGADGWLVLARCAGEPALCWVSAQTQGVSISDHACVDGNSLSSLSFEGVRLAKEQLLFCGAQVSGVVEQANDCARVIQAAELLGVMRRSFEITLDYIKTRKQFGRAIGTFQALKHRAVETYVHIEIAAACLDEVLSDIESGASLAASASRVKARCAHAGLLVTRGSIQFHGAIGFTDECNIGLYLKRAMFLSSWLGGAASHRARYLTQLPPESTEVETDLAAPVPKDIDWNQLSDQEFRETLRRFYHQHYPEAMRNIQRRLHWDEIKEWTHTLSVQGWLAPAWPKQFGGMGLAPDKLIAFVEEQEKYGVARVMDMGSVMVGPLLIQHGTPEQQQKFLPKILSAEHRWCQGYSEPGAGSDLASLRTEAVLDGKVFVVNGQKIWTTLAQDATHVFALVRTDKEAKKQAGISFLLIDLATPGITIRPIRDIAGHTEFCEVFFNDVRVPTENLVGQLNQGWSMAKTLLTFERIFLGSPKQGRYALSQLEQWAKKHNLFSDKMFAAKYAELRLDVADQAAAYSGFAEIAKRGETIPQSVSLLKIWGTEVYQRICLLLYEYSQEAGSMSLSLDPEHPAMNPSAILFNAIPSTIYGGSSEIQREIIARNVLDLSES